MQHELLSNKLFIIYILLFIFFFKMNGLQSTLFVKSPHHCQKISTDVASVQFIHQETRHHWIASAVMDSELFIFDSLLSTNGLIKETVSVLENIYGSFGQYITTDVTQQLGVKDCGLFAIAFITALCHGQQPEDFRINQKEMRNHFIACIEARDIKPFPATKKKRQRKPLKRWSMPQL